MRPKLYRDLDADAAMLAYRTGLSAGVCKMWIKSPVAKFAEVSKPFQDTDTSYSSLDDISINIIRSGIEAYALAQRGTNPRKQSSGAGALA